MNWPLIFFIAVGGALGALSRFGIKQIAEQGLGQNFPYGTLVANTLGCLVAGFLLSFWQTANLSPNLKQGLLIGFLGALTTFSSFSLETMNLIQQGVWFKAGINILGNLLLCLFCVFFGAWLGGRMSA